MKRASDMSDALTAIENRLCNSIERTRAQVEERVRRLSEVIVDKPFKSLGLAFLAGFVAARLLQKLG